MFCDSCKFDRLVKDFLNNSNICYQCVYRKKMEKTPKNKTSKFKYCRICDKEIIRLENQKQRQRTVFCSDECAKKGHQQLIKNYWTRKLRVANSWENQGDD